LKQVFTVFGRTLPTIVSYAKYVTFPYRVFYNL